MGDIRKLPYRAAPGIIPDELYGKAFNCPECGCAVQVPWLKNQNEPSQPIIPNSGVGFWVPADFLLKCNTQSCNNTFNVSTPSLPIECNWHLYGDEAGRYIKKPSNKYSNEPLHFFCITLVGLHRDKSNFVKTELEELKRSIIPDIDPNDWTHHFTQIWNSKYGNGKYTLRNKEEKIAYGKKLAKLIRDARPELVTFNISGCIVVPKNSKQRKNSIRYQKENTFSTSILSSLREMRGFNKSVKWIFDNIKDTTGGARTEGWASEAFLGLQYTRLFTWLSAGAPVQEPSFVTPGSHFLLEIADFVSYCVARDFEKSIRGEIPELPSSLFGRGFYHGTLGDGSAKSKWCIGLPKKEFYGVGE